MIFVTIFLIFISVFLLYYVIKLRQTKQEIIKVNVEIAEENDFLEQQHSQLLTEIDQDKQKLDEVKDSVEAQANILNSLSKAAEDMREGAIKQAQEAYEASVAALDEEYQSLNKKYKERLQDCLNKVVEEEAKVEDLKAKQLAYIQAKKREEEIKANESYYKLPICDEDINDITLLRDLQKRLCHKEAIDKLIWDVYYKTAYDTLMSHLFKTSGKIIGIYKITDLISGQSYIGQSVDIRERFRQHIKAGLSSAPATNKLYQAMKKDGLNNFTFEVLEEISRDKLNEREIYYIDLYDTKQSGMNKTSGGA